MANDMSMHGLGDIANTQNVYVHSYDEDTLVITDRTDPNLVEITFKRDGKNWRHLGRINVANGQVTNFNGILNIYMRSKTSDTSLIAALYVMVPINFDEFQIRAGYIGLVASGVKFYYVQNGSGTNTTSFDLWLYKEGISSVYPVKIEIAHNGANHIDKPNLLLDAPTNAVEIAALYGNVTGLEDALTGKQDTLTAGENITIEGNIISAVDTIPNNGILTIKQDGASKGSFSANQSSNAEVNIDLSGKQNKFNGDPMQLVKGDGTLTQGYVDFVHTLPGIYSALPAQPCNNGYMIIMTLDKKSVTVLAFTHCSIRISMARGTRPDTSSNFVFSGSYNSSWSDLPTAADVASLSSAISSGISSLRTSVGKWDWNSFWCSGKSNVSLNNSMSIRYNDATRTVILNIDIAISATNTTQLATINYWKPAVRALGVISNGSASASVYVDTDGSFASNSGLAVGTWRGQIVWNY
jgi:hypothetical protein